VCVHRYLLLFALCTAGRVELLPVFAYNLGEDAHVGAEEGEALHPDEGEGVVALELQEVGRQQPGALYRKNSVSFWVSRIRIRISNSIRSEFGSGSGSLHKQAQNIKNKP
jgi:hypothetical protein